MDENVRASAARSPAAASAKRRRRRSLRVSTRSRRPVSGSTSQSSPTFGSSCSRGSRISTATTSWRPASSSSGRRQSERAAEVGDDRDERTLTGGRRGPAESLGEGRRARARVVGIRAPQRGQQAEEARAALPRRERLRPGIAERDDAEPVPAPGRHVPERERDALGHVRLASVGRAERHRGRDVEHEPRRQDPLGEIDAHVRDAGSGGHVPVHPAHVVAGLVGTDLGQLAACPEPAGAVVAGEHALDPAADRQVERAQECIRQRPWPGPGCSSRARQRLERAHATLARPRSTCGSGTAATTSSRMASGVTSSASAW